MRQKLLRFMMGRYGTDRLSRHMLVLSLVLTLGGSVFSRLTPWAYIPYGMGLGFFIWGFVRIMSRNTAARYGELCGYEKFLRKVHLHPDEIRQASYQRKHYKIFKCPTCKQKLRIPRGKGNVEISCRMCKTVFRGKT